MIFRNQKYEVTSSGTPLPPAQPFPSGFGHAKYIGRKGKFELFPEYCSSFESIICTPVKMGVYIWPVQWRFLNTVGWMSVSEKDFWMNERKPTQLVHQDCRHWKTLRQHSVFAVLFGVVVNIIVLIYMHWGSWNWKIVPTSQRPYSCLGDLPLKCQTFKHIFRTLDLISHFLIRSSSLR